MRQSICGIASIICGTITLCCFGSSLGLFLLVLTIILASIGLADYLSYRWSSVAGMVLAILGVFEMYLINAPSQSQTVAKTPNRAVVESEYKPTQTAQNTVQPIESKPIETQPIEQEESKEQVSPNGKAYLRGYTWVVEGQWELTITDVRETSERNEYSDKNPQAVYLVDYEYKNLGYEDSMGGLFMTVNNSIVDSKGYMGYDYPLMVTDCAQVTPIGATCKATNVIGVDNAGDFTLNVSKYDSNSELYTATFNVKLP